MKSRHRDLLRQAETRGIPRPTTYREQQTLDALHRRGWITWTDKRGRPARVARITDVGREALRPTPAPRVQRPVYLRSGPLPPSRTVPSDDRAKPGPEQDYATDPAHGVLAAGEVLDPQTVDRFTIRARREREQRVELEQLDRGLLSVEDRMRAARRDANLARIDVRDEFRLVRKAREAGDEPGAVRHLERVERRIYRRAA